MMRETYEQDECEKDDIIFRHLRTMEKLSTP